jgi:hypothetical protein
MKVDYFSSLPQELIEQIGVAAMTLDPTPPRTTAFPSERSRLAVLYSLSMTSRQFHQIFNHFLYRDPVLIDSAHPDIPNTARRWIENAQVQHRARAARTFTLWRPSYTALTHQSHALNSTSLGLLLAEAVNVTELTLSGNFGGKCSPSSTQLRDSAVRRTSLTRLQMRVALDPDLDEIDGLPNTRSKSVMPNLTTLRLVDVENAEMIPDLFNPYRTPIKTLEIRPSLTSGIGRTYHPRTVIEHLSSFIVLMLTHSPHLESLHIALPPEQFDFNNCRHGTELLSTIFLHTNRKPNFSIRNLTLSLPQFDCHSYRYMQAGDSDEDSDEDDESIDHAYFFDLLSRVLADFNSLQQFSYSGPVVPVAIERKLRAQCPGVEMQFAAAEWSKRSFQRDALEGSAAGTFTQGPLPPALTTTWSPPPLHAEEGGWITDSSGTATTTLGQSEEGYGGGSDETQEWNEYIEYDYDP